MKSDFKLSDFSTGVIAPEFTQILDLEYFHLKHSLPEMSLSANQMITKSDEIVEFDDPKGIYNFKPSKGISYKSDLGIYQKDKDLLVLKGKVDLQAESARCRADSIRYHLKKDLIIGKGNVEFDGKNPKTSDHFQISSQKMRASPSLKKTTFEEEVHGSIERKKKYEGKTLISTQKLILDGEQSVAHLEGNVELQRGNYDITAGKADMFLENYNKSLKYLVLNDDVKLTEKLIMSDGTTQKRRAFAERLEGFGQEQKMVLSGAPRVEMGKDVIKGYRIIIRENVDLVEVDDAMSDVEINRNEN